MYIYTQVQPPSLAQSSSLLLCERLGRAPTLHPGDKWSEQNEKLKCEAMDIFNRAAMTTVWEVRL